MPPISATLSSQDRLKRQQRTRLVALVSLGVDLGLACAKFAVGVVARSQSLVADAVHSLSDSTTDIALLVGAPYWSSPADDSHPYGHGRIETLVTASIGLVLVGIGVGLFHKALVTLASPHESAPGWSAFVAACVSIAVKEGLYRWSVREGARLKSSAMFANAWHHRSDAFSSVPVALAVVGTRLNPSWTFLDHVGALMVALLILQAAWHIVWPALRELADAGADGEVQDALFRLAASVSDVEEIHALRTRHIGPGLQVDLHVLVDPALTVEQGHEISQTVERLLLDSGPDVVDVLVHVEPFRSQLLDTRAG